MDPRAFSSYLRLGVSEGYLATELYRLALDHIRSDDIYFTPYSEHRQTHLLEVISWYSIWLIIGSQVMYMYLFE